jgi:thiosulfate dehydrogenase [quinone] large subunit
MATTQKYEFAGFEVVETLTDDWQRVWIAFLRVLTGWWFFHAGITKIMTDGFNFAYGPIYLKTEMGGTVLGPLAVWMGNNLAWLIKPGVPLFETLIGLGLMLGVLTRLAAVGGVFFMTMFFVGNGAFSHGMVNSDLMGLLLFLTMIVFAAGRYWGLDAIIEQTKFVKNHPRLRYLLG